MASNDNFTGKLLEYKHSRSAKLLFYFNVDVAMS